MFTLFGLTFHLYGLIVGLALAIGISLVEKKARQQGLAENEFWSLVLWMVVAGIIGARLWHVVTDFYLYQEQLIDAIKIWNGGLSILGAVVGGMVGLWLWQRRFPENISTKTVLDLAIFGLPIGQAVGRWGNYVNQELYGLPTNLPWAITIDPEYRVAGFSQSQTFHPLFAYEMIATAVFGIGVWWFDAKRKQQKQKNLIGTGIYFWLYVMYYSTIRFGLDFLRVEKTVIEGFGMGINQIILLGVIVLAGTIVFQIHKKARLWLVLVFVVGFMAVGCMPRTPVHQTEDIVEQLQAKPDHGQVTILINDKELEVEVVNQAASITQGLSGRTEIGSGGMLFVLGQKRMPTFWMKEMLFNLDLVWISDGEVVEVTADVPALPMDTPLGELPRYTPEQEVNMVLELPAGKALELGVSKGTQIQLVTLSSL